MTTYFDEDGRPKYKVDKDPLTNTWYVCTKQMLFVGKPLRWVVEKGGFPSERSALNYAREKFDG